MSLVVVADDHKARRHLSISEFMRARATPRTAICVLVEFLQRLCNAQELPMHRGVPRIYKLGKLRQIQGVDGVDVENAAAFNANPQHVVAPGARRPSISRVPFPHLMQEAR